MVQSGAEERFLVVRGQNDRDHRATVLSGSAERRPLRWPPLMASLDTIFKAYDIRGLYGSDIDGDGAELIGRAFTRVISNLSL